jgi:hypothetical protein
VCAGVDEFSGRCNAKGGFVSAELAHILSKTGSDTLITTRPSSKPTVTSLASLRSAMHHARSGA